MTREINLLPNYCYRERVPLIISEIPIYSISKYNSVAGHNFPELFSDQDIHLSEQLSISNQEIQDINDISFTGFSTFLPGLLLRNRSNVRLRRQRTYYYNFNLYGDGVHPKTLLANLWLMKLALMVKRDCF